MPYQKGSEMDINPIEYIKGMQFEKKITMGNVIEIVIILVIVISSFVVLQHKTETLVEKQLRLEAQVDRLDDAIAEMERRMSTQFVRNEVLVEIKTQLTDIKAEIRQLKR